MTCTKMLLNGAIKQIGLTCVAIVWLAALGLGQPKVTRSPKVGPPTTNVLVSGSGLPADDAVDIYFDTTDLALAATNSTGAFSDIPIPVPASALPGTHYVTAVARSNGEAAQTTFAVQTNWAEKGFTQKGKRSNPYENVLSPSKVGAIDVHWSYTTGSYVVSSPAVANKGGAVYVGSYDDNVYALNATTGAKLWSYTTGSEVESSPAVANGVVYVGSFDSNVYALNATTGAKLWSYPTGNEVGSSPAVADGVVYVGSDDDKVYALNATTGAKLWSYTTGSAVESSPAVANGVVYVGSLDLNVYAFDQQGGDLARPAPPRPDPNTLRPDFNLKVSQPVTKLPSNDNN